MRNVFDQYDQPENKLTHALVVTLSSDRKLIRPFLRELGVRNVPHLKDIRIGQQQVPGQLMAGDGEKAGLPDACFYDTAGWAVLLESKVQAGISVDQLRRHQRTAARHGYENAQVFLFAVDKPKRGLPPGVNYRAWKSVYAWFVKRGRTSEWARRLTEYIEVFESKMSAKEYNIGGTLTMFNGFHFDDEHPYTYREGKRLLKLVRGELLKNKRLIKTLGLDVNSEGRSKITENEDSCVWDYIPLREARGRLVHTDFPHCTVVLRPTLVDVILIIPNGVRGGLRSKFRQMEPGELEELLMKVEKRLRPVFRQVPEGKPTFRAHQRHYETQSSPPILDGDIRFDLRALLPGGAVGVKYQPTWVGMMRDLMADKRSNIEMGMVVSLPYSVKAMQSPKALDLIADSWIATKPLLDLVLEKQMPTRQRR